MISFRAGVGSLAALETTRSACCGVARAAALVVARVGVELVGVAYGRRVEFGAGAHHTGGQPKESRGGGVHRPRVPYPGGAVVAPLAGGGRHESQPGRQLVVDQDAGGDVGPEVVQGDGEGDEVPHVGRGVADHLGEGKVGLLGGDCGAGRVVARVGVELIGMADRRGVGLGAGADHPGLDQQGLRRRRGHRADRPDAGGAVVVSLAGSVRDEGQAARQRVGHRDVGGVARAGVGQGEGVGDRVADVGRGDVHRFGVAAQVGLLGVDRAPLLLLAGFGSKTSEWPTLAVLASGLGLTTRAMIVSVWGSPG